MTRRAVIVITVALGLVLASAGLAQGQAAIKSVTTSGYTFRQIGGLCAWAVTTISNDWGQPAMISEGTQDGTGTDGSLCGRKDHLAAPYAIALRQSLLMWYDGAWRICDPGVWVQNPGWAHSVSTGYGWGRAPCGSLYYRSGSEVMAWTAGGWGGQGVVIRGNDWILTR